MVLFESGRVPHGRQEPLDGRFFDNLFVHFYPVAAVWYGREFDVANLPEKILSRQDLL